MNTQADNLAREIRNGFRTLAGSNADAISSNIVITRSALASEAQSTSRIEGVTVADLTRQIADKQAFATLSPSDLFFEFPERFAQAGITNPRKQAEQAQVVAQRIKDELQKEIAALRETKAQLSRQIAKDKSECGAAVREQVILPALNKLFSELGAIMHEYLPQNTEVTLASGEVRTVSVADFVQEAQRFLVSIKPDNSLQAVVNVARLGSVRA